MRSLDRARPRADLPAARSPARPSLRATVRATRAIPRATLQAAGALLTAAVVVLGVAGPAPRAEAEPDLGVSAADAPYLVLGYLWGDGYRMPDGQVGFSTPVRRIADRFAQAAVVSGARVERRSNGRRYGVRIHGFGPTVVFDRLPPALRSAPDSATRAFLVGVIETEGLATGLVIDDPDPARPAAVAPLLARVGVRSHTEGTRLVKLVAEPADWHVFRGFPFCWWKRVPGVG